MKIKSTQKYVRMSPRKLRLVAAIARQMNPEEAVIKLPFLNKRAKGPIIKVIKTAIANGKVKGFTADQLEFEEIQIGEGPRLKRGRAVSRGRWHPYQRKMSHIRVVLKTKEDVKPKVKKQKKVAKPKSRRIALSKIKGLRSRKDDKTKTAKETGGNSKKKDVKTVKDRKTVRTTNK